MHVCTRMTKCTCRKRSKWLYKLKKINQPVKLPADLVNPNPDHALCVMGGDIDIIKALIIVED